MARDIYAYKCRKCGQLHYPYRMVCKKCRANEHNEFDPVPLPKSGKLITFTRLHTLPGDFEVPTILLGIVELENGMRITGQLKIAEPRAGMPVRGDVELVRQSGYDRHYGMVFYGA
jgi:uncharacterized OB-fold protein